jgi:hypothetical protein
MIGKVKQQQPTCCENGKILLPSLPVTPQELEVFLTSKERSAVKF